MENRESYTKEELLSHIDYEINQVVSDQVKPGWTSWAILAAIGSLLWLSIIELTTNLFDLDHVLYALLAIYFLYDIFSFLRKKINKLSSSITSGGLHEENVMEILTRGSALLILLESMIAAYLCYYFRDTIPGYAFTLSLIFLSVIVFTYCAALVFRALGLPLNYVTSGTDSVVKSSSRLGKNTNFISTILLFVIPLVITFALFSSFDYHLLTVFDIRMLFLILGILVLTHIFLENVRKPKLLQDLVNLRRDVVIDAVDLTSANNDFVAIVKGLDSTQFLQKYTSSYLKLKREYENAVTQITNVKNEYLENIKVGTDKAVLAKFEVQTFNLFRQAILCIEKMNRPTELIMGLSMYRLAVEDIDISQLFSRIRNERNAAKDTVNSLVFGWYEVLKTYAGDHKAVDFIDELNKLSKKLDFDTATGKVKGDLVIQKLLDFNDQV